jgi:hypothetical protein
MEIWPAGEQQYGDADPAAIDTENKRKTSGVCLGRKTNTAATKEKQAV